MGAKFSSRQEAPLTGLFSHACHTHSTKTLLSVCEDLTACFPSTATLNNPLSLLLTVNLAVV